MYSPYYMTLVLLVFLFAGCSDCSGTQARARVDSSTKTQAPTLVGLWQSKDDESFTREFTADGKVVDRYTGDSSADEIGAYTTVDTSKEIIEDVPADLLKDVHVIKLSFSETDLYFSVVTLTQNELELGFIGRGNTLSFKRLK